MKSVANWVMMRLFGHKPFKKSTVGGGTLYNYLHFLWTYRSVSNEKMLRTRNFTVLASNY
jgi:hypothetical protein